MPPSLPGSLYSPDFEKDSCGFGLLANMDAQASHWLVQTAIRSLTRLGHRGAIAPDGKTGDGCGLLFRMPDSFFRAIARQMNVQLASRYAIAQVFLSPDPAIGERALSDLKAELEREGCTVAGQRAVPINPAVCGEYALRTLPRIVQLFVNAPDYIDEELLERRLFMARRRAEKQYADQPGALYICSLSSRSVIYKGMILPANLPVFYPDLLDERFTSSLCIYHQRFSTNTWPEWRLAQPFRYLAHNGEINTISGNRNWTQSRAGLLASPVIPDFSDAMPLGASGGSDSMTLDEVLEGHCAGGMDIRLAIRTLIPPAWQNRDAMDPDLRAMFEFYALSMEPWDGPAGLVMTDGRRALCTMDRNGLRPARWVITADRHLTVASEIGVYDYAPADVIAKGKLGPGEMLCLDLQTGALSHTEEIDAALKTRLPFRQWLSQHARYINDDLETEGTAPDELPPEQLPVYEKAFLLTWEEREQILRPLVEDAQEAVGSMGDDTPLPVLSRSVRSPYDYLRQQFAQVTNPPIDSIRELTVMSLRTALGREYNPLDEREAHAKRVDIASPVLSRRMLQQMLSLPDPEFSSYRIDITYPESETLRQSIQQITDQAVEAVRQGKVFLVLSDRNIAQDRLPIHALLAAGATHQRLCREGLRCRANIYMETATARDPHHFAALLSVGATAVYPYLAYQCIADMTRSAGEPTQASRKIRAYRRGIHKGLFKILSKMGISTLNSYRGAQLFEAVGLHSEVMEVCFPGIVSRIEGASFEDLEADQRTLHREAWNPARERRQGGLLKFTPEGEDHAFNPDVVAALQHAVRSGLYEDYQLYAERVNRRSPLVLRDLLRLVPRGEAIPLSEVEPAESILRRFDSAAMSLGSLSPEAHEAIAIAMNRIGGRSNSGEGGEDASRYGTERVSKIKQIASGRFGVTPAYLVNAEVLQIKVAQGAKPGEGGQLPGNKVTELIARLRCTLPGTPLISPPPHHDIYSIEDLAQLIFDLKQINPAALVSVKLVSEPGVGTVAAGVAKTYADLITIAGYDGGTGASPLTSIKYAGCPWELGLVETQQTLRANDLRGQVRIQVDGGLKTGLDIIKAAILGAESFGFGTAPLIALGCKYLRICHLNNCATGVATQNPLLRRHHFHGEPERVERFFRFVAEEVRHWLAYLGVRSLEEIIGYPEYLTPIEGATDKQRKLNLSPLLALLPELDAKPRFCRLLRNEPNDKAPLAEKMRREMEPAITNKLGGIFNYEITNADRSMGAAVAGDIARLYGDEGLKDAPLTVHFSGVAGQSFGAWNINGLNLILKGDANDYVGKGMSGGKLVIFPPRNSRFETQQTPIMGNTCLYGATGGRLFAAGTAGERFAVRNSGAMAVVEGVGNHGCEYMTGGVVVVLGRTGYNFGAGMTGGLAYVLDPAGDFVDRYNHELVDIHRIHTENREEWAAHLYKLIGAFVSETCSPWGQSILHDFPGLIQQFWLVKPKATEMETLLGLISLAT